jgi:tRNA threonylcarbamoyladenosine biosynthesis protein TsaB
MIVLGFDTATAVTAVGLRLEDGSVLEAFDDPVPGSRPGHATQLLALGDALLTRAGLRWGAIERVAVGLGPGTFTGLRVGVATAHGLARSLAVELVGVSSLQALALVAARGDAAPNKANRELASGGAVPARGVLSVIDARRGEAFTAAYLAGSELVAPAPVAPAALGEVLAQAQALAPGTREWVAVGDGAIRFRSELEAARASVAADQDASHRVSGGAICELGLDAQPTAPSAVVPDYRRRPDAELTLQETQR